MELTSLLPPRLEMLQVKYAISPWFSFRQYFRLDMLRIAQLKRYQGCHLNLDRIVWWWDPTVNPFLWKDISCVTCDSRWLDTIRERAGIDIEFIDARELRDTPLGKPSCCPDRFVVNSISPQEVRQRGVPVIFNPDFPKGYEDSFESYIGEAEEFALQRTTVGLSHLRSITEYP